MTDLSKDDRVYLIEKRGLYYRPEAAGYTGIKDEAGRYSLAEVAEHMPNMDSANQDGASFIHEDDAPDYTRACYHDLKERHQAKKLAEAATRIEALERELAEANAAPRMIKAMGESIEEIRENAMTDPLYQRGDMILVWVNEGDLYNRLFALAAHRARKEANHD